jgi:hypothetical protein
VSKVDQGALMARIEKEHRSAPHPGIAGPRLRLHVAIHTVVETQLLEGRPAETAVTLARLEAEGLDRHGAVHAIGTVVSSEIFEVMQEGKAYDEARYVTALRALSARSVVAGGAE